MSAKEEKQQMEEEFKRARAKHAPLQKKIDDAKANVEKIDDLIKKTVSFCFP